VSWTSSLAQAETDENAYRAAMKGSQNSYYRWDARGAVLAGNWVGARAAASSVKVPASNTSYWLNVAIRAATAMGGGWSVITAQPLALLFSPSSTEMNTHAPNGSIGPLDGLFGGLMDPWAASVWTTSGGTLPTTAYPAQETWSWLLANTLTIAGAT
jgi:hypothetical protein